MRRHTHSLRRLIVAAVLLPYLLLQVQAAAACVLLDAGAANPCAMQQEAFKDAGESKDCCQLGYQPASTVHEAAPLSAPDVTAHVALPSPILLYVVAIPDETTSIIISKYFSPPSSSPPLYLATLRLRI